MIVAIDPSLNNIGFARYIELENQNNVGVIQTSTLRILNEGKLEDRLRAISQRLKWQIDVFRCADAKVFICEYPSFQNSMKGKVAATSGDTFALAAIGGMIRAIVPFRAKVMLPTPSEWKGQTPKEVSGRRFTKWTESDYRKITDHEVDAAMMIAWYLQTTYGTLPRVSWTPL